MSRKQRYQGTNEQLQAHKSKKEKESRNKSDIADEEYNDRVKELQNEYKHRDWTDSNTHDSYDRDFQDISRNYTRHREVEVNDGYQEVERYAVKKHKKGSYKDEYGNDCEDEGHDGDGNTKDKDAGFNRRTRLLKARLATYCDPICWDKHIALRIKYRDACRVSDFCDEPYVEFFMLEGVDIIRGNTLASKITASDFMHASKTENNGEERKMRKSLFAIPPNDYLMKIDNYYHVVNELARRNQYRKPDCIAWLTDFIIFMLLRASFGSVATDVHCNIFILQAKSKMMENFCLLDCLFWDCLDDPINNGYPTVIKAVSLMVKFTSVWNYRISKQSSDGFYCLPQFSTNDKMCSELVTKFIKEVFEMADIAIDKDSGEDVIVQSRIDLFYNHVMPAKPSYKELDLFTLDKEIELFAYNKLVSWNAHETRKLTASHSHHMIYSYIKTGSYVLEHRKEGTSVVLKSSLFDMFISNGKGVGFGKDKYGDVDNSHSIADYTMSFVPVAKTVAKKVIFVSEVEEEFADKMNGILQDYQWELSKINIQNTPELYEQIMAEREQKFESIRKEFNYEFL